MVISHLDPNDTAAIHQAAEALLAAFAMLAPETWPDLESALQEVREALQADRICLVAQGADGRVQGWLGGRHSYARVWEVHPLVVHPDSQLRGIGRNLIAALEAEVRRRDGLTMLLGADDQSDMTTLSGVDLYEDTWAHLSGIQNLRRHPFEFYQKCGYKIVGVVPDANGYGRPDILMAKRL
jgi:aminoglycoside 6'-N-acetyltransferase I